MSALRTFWVDKYAPKEIDDYIFQDAAQKKLVLKIVIEQSLPNLMLSGIQGTGKSSLAALLLRELAVDESDILVINASNNTSVDMVRDEIMPFITSWAVGDYKVVVLEEVSRLSAAAQEALKVPLEQYADVVRFIFTTNEENKIIPAVKSRFQTLRFKSHDKKIIGELLTKILDTEKVKYTADQVPAFVEAGYPDIRQTIHLLEQHTSGGKLSPIVSLSHNAEYKSVLLDIIENDNWPQMKNLVVPYISMEEWDGFYKFLYENLHKSPNFSADDERMGAAVVWIAEHLYRHTFVSDPAINGAALAVRLSQI